MKNNAVPSVPRNAQRAASVGFDFCTGCESFEQRFVGDSKMLRRGVMEVESSARPGHFIKIPFTAEFNFGKPRRMRGQS